VSKTEFSSDESSESDQELDANEKRAETTVVSPNMKFLWLFADMINTYT